MSTPPDDHPPLAWSGARKIMSTPFLPPDLSWGHSFLSLVHDGDERGSLISHDLFDGIAIARKRSLHLNFATF